MADPVTVNPIATLVNSALSDAFSLGSSAIEDAIIADVPFLGLPVFKQLLELGLSYVEGYFYDDAALAATKIILDLQTKAEVTNANAAFKNVQTAVASGDANQIQAASQSLDDAFASLAHSDGSASP